MEEPPLEPDHRVDVDQLRARPRLLLHTCLFEQLDREHQQVAEVGRVGGPQQLLVAAPEQRDQAGHEALEPELLDLGDGEAAVLELVEVAEDRPRLDLVLVAVQLLEHALHQAGLVVGVVDGEVARQADRLAVATEDPRRDRVERADPQLRQRVPASNT